MDVALKPGKVVNGRWSIVCKLGNGGCGAVFKVEDLQRKGFMAAMKAEKITQDEHGVLKLEASLLKKLQRCPNTIRLFGCGRRKYYNYMVMSLCGSDLYGLRANCPEQAISDSSTLRIGIQLLYAIKQVHEVGYVHRDVKPGNVMNGLVGRESRMFYLIDYGMARSIVVKGSTTQSRAQRTGCLFRGTRRYCSLNVHRRVDQGRVDDLWAMLYTLTEIFAGVPWRLLKDEKEIRQMKESMSDAEVFKECPKCFMPIAAYLRGLKYGDRPDYYLIYKLMMDEMKNNEFSLLDPYEWEKEAEDAVYTALEYNEREKSTLKTADADLEFRQFPHLTAASFQERILQI